MAHQPSPMMPLPLPMPGGPGSGPADELGHCVERLRLIEDAEVERLRNAASAEVERQQLIRHIYQAYTNLNDRYADLVADYESQKIANRHIVLDHQALQREVGELKRSQREASPLVGVFIDGDGAKFQESLVAMGSDGGEKAAHALQDEIRRELRDLYPGSNTSNWRIMVVVIAAVESLGYAYHNHLAYHEGYSSVAHWPTTLRQFMVGFNRGAHHTFSFVDIGGGKGLKELTDTKLRETFSMMFPHCKHVFFAGCHDSGYVSFLGPYKHDPKDAEKLTLIEAHNTSAHYYNLGFRMTKFPGIFRSEDFSSAPSRITTSGYAPPNGAHNGPHNGAHNGPHNGQITPPTATTIPARTSSISELARLTSPFPAPTPSQTPSTHRAATPSGSSHASSSWVTVSKSGVPPPTNKTIDIAPAKKKAKAFIALNRDNERVDIQLPKHNKMAEQTFHDRVKAQGQNFCNQCNIYGPSSCDQTDQRYLHGRAELSADELAVLRNKVRGLPCTYGSGCPDSACAFGHHCRNGRNCTMNSCRFADTHHMDIRPYKKVYDDGSTEII